MGEWQKIETAPITQDVLIFCPDLPVCQILIGGEFEDGWFSELDPSKELYPTHWMPLPSPPADPA